MITNTEIKSMAEANECISNADISQEKIKGFINKFIKIDFKDAEKLKSEIKGLSIMKIKPFHIAKIIDLIPEDIDDVNKIFTDMGLNEDETKKILEITKKFK